MRDSTQRLRNNSVILRRCLKEKGLPPEILERHYKFVKHYEDNLKELNDNLDAIDKSKKKSDAEAAIGRAKSHLEKVKACRGSMFR